MAYVRRLPFGFFLGILRSPLDLWLPAPFACAFPMKSPAHEHGRFRLPLEALSMLGPGPAFGAGVPWVIHTNMR